MTQRWLQIRGDPSVRQFVFDQRREKGAFDERLDEVLGRAGRLLRDYGVFHAKVHFSTGQVTLWLLSDPLRYRVYVKDEFLDSAFCSIFPRMTYTPWATVPRRTITRVLGEFKRLRTQDEHIYLRSGSLNVINGLVGLNFSCDGSHYLGHADFLANAGQLYV
ncbi:MAG: hypothetical protein A2V91_04305 [Candidatus Muproteobacteria bacterium RBG_16_64_10]|uniref:Uncharacterized protein n=1 Tax=Candidatus Muproteobacteria bacterium RBG_16_64_10 TaxID=1817757 RepID=A0A1F6SWW8_9PROT|nr:MAG: hypothetical protein A2V91_04305 [Candidatus Muproteobacteria bacterium RBG_16_64_10]